MHFDRDEKNVSVSFSDRENKSPMDKKPNHPYLFEQKNNLLSTRRQRSSRVDKQLQVSFLVHRGSDAFETTIAAE